MLSNVSAREPEFASVAHLSVAADRARRDRLHDNCLGDVAHADHLAIGRADLDTGGAAGLGAGYCWS